MEAAEPEDDFPAFSKADLPQPYEADPGSLDSDDEFGDAAFELLKESTLLVVLLVHVLPTTPFSRNEAIKRGLLKRVGLLGKSLLSDICHNSGYLQEPISRQIIEAAANYLYLAADDGSGARFDAYIEHSLAEEKASLEIVAGQIAQRGGNALPIEERMHRSIARMASAAGMDFEDVPGKGKIGWPSAVDRLAALSPVAYMPYRTGSNAVHSGWSVLLARDIEPVEGGFSLENGPYPAVQPMTAAGLMSADAAVHYLEQDGTRTEREWFLDRLVDVAQRIQALDEAHEAFIQEQAES